MNFSYITANLQSLYSVLLISRFDLTQKVCGILRRRDGLPYNTRGNLQCCAIEPSYDEICLCDWRRSFWNRQGHCGSKLRTAVEVTGLHGFDS